MTYRAAGLAALADPTRRAIFERLGDGPRAVGELARELPVSRPAVSQHLKVLKEAGLVLDRREGNRRIYQLDADGVGALRAYLDQFWKRALSAFKQAVERECRWARVLAYEPPHRLVFSWDISTHWQLESDPERTSEVEVRFMPEGEDRTRVELEHRKLERHGEGWQGMRDAVGSPDGWAKGLRALAQRVER
jgi:DNA-binding transcriptional ArsR family regulator